MLDAWRALGRNVEEVKPFHKQIVEEDYGQGDGQLRGYVPAHVTARK